MFFLLLKGLVIGFSIAAPVGVIGTLCIRRSIAKGRLSGFVTGLGAATADSFYGAVAAYGLTAVLNFLVHMQQPLRLFGGLFLLYLGAKTFKTETKIDQQISFEDTNMLKDYFSTFALTLTNPSTIFSFIGIFAGIGIQTSHLPFSSATILVIGVFLGSTIWWLILSGIVALVREKITTGTLNILNKVSGSIIFTFGIIALVAFLKAILLKSVN